MAIPLGWWRREVWEAGIPSPLPVAGPLTLALSSLLGKARIPFARHPMGRASPLALFSQVMGIPKNCHSSKCALTIRPESMICAHSFK